MRMPGFNADASLCMTKGYYYMTEGSAIAVQLNPANLIREMESTLFVPARLPPFTLGLAWPLYRPVYGVVVHPLFA